MARFPSPGTVHLVCGTGTVPRYILCGIPVPVHLMRVPLCLWMLCQRYSSGCSLTGFNYLCTWYANWGTVPGSVSFEPNPGLASNTRTDPDPEMLRDPADPYLQHSFLIFPWSSEIDRMGRRPLLFRIFIDGSIPSASCPIKLWLT